MLFKGHNIDTFWYPTHIFRDFCQLIYSLLLDRAYTLKLWKYFNELLLFLVVDGVEIK